MATYLSVLADSLNKKIRLLSDLTAENETQEAILKAVPVDFDAFDETVEIKGRIIEELEKLDEGFDSLYEKVRVELLEKREEYIEEITQLKALVLKVTDMSVAIQAGEERNRSAVAASFTNKRNEMRAAASTLHVSKQYSQNMNQSVIPESMFLDSKK